MADGDVEEIRVIGVTPTEGAELDPLKIPAYVQTATAADLERTRSLDLSDYMNRVLGSVSINSAQNNPLQPDVQYRGFNGNPPHAIAFKMLLGEDDEEHKLEPDLGTRTASIRLLNAANTYHWKATWGGGWRRSPHRLAATTRPGFFVRRAAPAC